MKHACLALFRLALYCLALFRLALFRLALYCLALYCLALFVGLLPATGLSAPPLRCDDVPHAVTFPQSPSTRTVVPPKEPHTPVAEPSRRQRLQSLKDRVNKLKSNLENPPPPPAAETGPSLRIEPPVVVLETSPSDPTDPSASPLPVTPPVLVDLEPAPSPQPVQPPEPQPQPAPEPLPEPAPQPTVERPTPPSESSRPLPPVPAQATPIPTPAASDIPPSREDSPLTLPTELLDQAIDRQRMGNNLYAIGAHELALMNYEMMLRQPLGPDEAQWVQFQVANCQRHLGQLAEAQKAYRRVAGETSEEWLGQLSRWWLKELDDREQLQSRVAELDQIIKTLEQESNRDP